MKGTDMNRHRNTPPGTQSGADDLIEAYVADVALRLPRAQRNDVAYELRALLHEELQAKAEAAGQPLDEAMTLAFLRGFGRPADVAARYRPTLTIIDPSDGRRFLFATVVGLALIWSLGLVAHWHDAAEHGLGTLNMIARWWVGWWVGTVLPSLWWPGVLVTWFALSAWVRRRWPRTTHWTPRLEHHIAGGRTAMVLGVVGMLCGMTLLIEPRWILDVVWGGNAAPAAYTALTYTDTFLRGPAFVLLALIAANVPLYIAVMANGRWSPRLRRIETALGLVSCAAMLWAVVDGPIFLSAHSDGTAKVLLALIAAFSLIYYAIKTYRRVRPTPGGKAHALR
jgi:hypothetical protein